MTPRDFCYWLHGRLELVEVIKRHLAFVFTNVTAQAVPLVPLTPEDIERLLRPSAPSEPWQPSPLRWDIICDSSASPLPACNCSGGCKAWGCTNL